MVRYLVLIISIFWLSGCSAAQEPAATGAKETSPVVLYSSDNDFEFVTQDIKIAIQNRGLVIDHTSHIADMLERTGKDLGTPKRLYLKGEAYSFCSAVLSRKMMDADWRNIVFCPYSLAVYVTPEEPKRVYAGFRRLPLVGSDSSKAALKEVNNLLDGILREALNIK